MELKENESLCWTKLHNGVIVSTIFRKSSAMTNTEIYYFETLVFDKTRGKILEQAEANTKEIAINNQIILTTKYF